MFLSLSMARIGETNIFLFVLEKDLNEDKVLLLHLLIDTGVIFLGHTLYNLLDIFHVFLHFLMVSPALGGAPRHNHIRHHFEDSNGLLFAGILEDLSEVLKKNCVFESLLLVPKAVS